MKVASVGYDRRVLDSTAGVPALAFGYVAQASSCSRRDFAPRFATWRSASSTPSKAGLHEPLRLRYQQYFSYRTH